MMKRLALLLQLFKTSLIVKILLLLKHNKISSKFTERLMKHTLLNNQ